MMDNDFTDRPPRDIVYYALFFFFIGLTILCLALCHYAEHPNQSAIFPKPNHTEIQNIPTTYEVVTYPNGTVEEIYNGVVKQ